MWVYGRKSSKKPLELKTTGNPGLEMATRLDFGWITGVGPLPSIISSPPFLRWPVINSPLWLSLEITLMIEAARISIVLEPSTIGKLIWWRISSLFFKKKGSLQSWIVLLGKGQRMQLSQCVLLIIYWLQDLVLCFLLRAFRCIQSLLRWPSLRGKRLGVRF